MQTAFLALLQALLGYAKDTRSIPVYVGAVVIAAIVGVALVGNGHAVSLTTSVDSLRATVRVNSGRISTLEARASEDRAVLRIELRYLSCTEMARNGVRGAKPVEQCFAEYQDSIRPTP